MSQDTNRKRVLGGQKQSLLTTPILRKRKLGLRMLRNLPRVVILYTVEIVPDVVACQKLHPPLHSFWTEPHSFRYFLVENSFISGNLRLVLDPSDHVTFIWPMRHKRESAHLLLGKILLLIEDERGVRVLSLPRLPHLPIHNSCL